MFWWHWADQNRLLAIFLLCTFPSLIQVDNLSFQAAEVKKKKIHQCNFLTLNILNFKYFPEVILYPQFYQRQEL